MIAPLLSPAPRFVRRLLASAVAAAAFTAAGAATIPLTQLDLSHLHFAGWKRPQIDVPAGAKPLSIAGRLFTHGVASYATTTLWLVLDGRVERFQAAVGVDDAATDPNAAVVFSVIGDDRVLWQSPVLRRGEPALAVDVPLAGIHSLLLKIDHAATDAAGDYAVWAEPRFTYGGAAPRTVAVPYEPAVLLTPQPSPSPRINGPEVYGCRPAHPFLYRIPTTGERPMAFSAEGLPATLHLDPTAGIVTGSAPARGTYVVTLRATNRRGQAQRPFKIVSGDTLALTPPMGWNDWYANYRRVTDATIRQAADTLVASGMADVGYAYVNIDDCWAHASRRRLGQPDSARVGPLRDAAGNILPNRFFPDMAALTAYIHSKGLKAGIYSSPGPLTCAGYAGSYQHEEQDARQFAAWGFDFLKYDWCSYDRIVHRDHSLPTLQRPYRLMGDALRQLPRDVVFNLCQYGMGNVWTWGAAVGGNCWRTSGDLGGELNRVVDVALANVEHAAAWSKPGAWNDPDYLQIGYVGDAHGGGGLARPCPLTPTEQYSFMSLWSLMAAPLVYSGDMGRLDAFTLNVLCNPEVIAIDQDPLGRCARAVRLTPDTFLLVKPLADGSTAVGLCNRGDISVDIRARWADVGVTGPQHVRDVWRERDLGVLAAGYDAVVHRHGVVLLRLSAAALR